MNLLPHFKSVPPSDSACEICARLICSLRSLRISAQGTYQSCRLRYLGVLQAGVEEEYHHLDFYYGDTPSLYHELEESAPRYRGEVLLYTKLGFQQSSWPIVGVRRDVRPRRTSYAAIVQDWIKVCRDTHPACQNNINVELPTRIVEVGLVDPDQIRLNKSLGQNGKYLALSHCWGGGIAIKITQENLATREEGIRFVDLPKTFQDAVTVTRDLGVHYLWIDALCIIQDDEQDWQNESGNMAAIYQNVYIVVGAVMAMDSNRGFLDPAKGSYNKDGLPIAIVDNEMTTIYTRLHRLHGNLCSMSQVRGERPLFTRT